MATEWVIVGVDRTSVFPHLSLAVTHARGAWYNLPVTSHWLPPTTQNHQIVAAGYNSSLSLSLLVMKHENGFRKCQREVYTSKTKDSDVY